jgi:hypothetical protein
MNRRELLAALGALGIAPAARAFGPASDVDVAEIDLPGTLSRPQAWVRLLYEVVHTTSVSCDTASFRLRPDDPALFEHPFAVLLGAERFTQPDEVGLEQLSRYLQYGGFLVLDDTSGSAESGFDAAARELCASLFPTRPLSPLPADHSIFRSFFLLDRPVGRVDRYPYLEGITVGTNVPVVLCRNDLSGALDRGRDGRHTYPVVPGGEVQRKEAVKLAVNLILYALTSNYKQDQVHVRRLLMEGRIE